MSPVDSEKIVFVASKNRDEEVRVSEVMISGRAYISVAVFLKEGGVFRRGITLAPQLFRELLPVLAKAVEDVGEKREP
jgi:hypothetical protein